MKKGMRKEIFCPYEIQCRIFKDEKRLAFVLKFKVVVLDSTHELSSQT